MNKELRTRRLTRKYVVVFISLLAVLAFAATASGNLTGSPFDGGDGNLVLNDETQDWVNAPNRQAGTDLPTGQSDDSFGQGAKEDTEIPAVVDGSIPNNKSDLTRFYVANQKVGDDEFLYLAWERVQEPNGTTNMDFEFNQSSTLSSNGVTPVRTAGDVLIKYDLSQGGVNPTLGFHRWVTTGLASQCEASNSVPCWGTGNPLSGNFEGAVNTVVVTDPIPDPDVSLSLRTFGEAAINLTDSNILPGGSCQGFGRAYLKSRSSDSFTAALKDFIAPIPVNISNCGTITIKKETNPDGAAGSFQFTHDVGSNSNPTVASPFSLSDGGSQAFLQAQAGSYVFTESSLPTGWVFDRIECTGDGSTITEDEPNKKVTIVLVADSDPVCTFYNNRQPTLSVVKACVPSTDTGKFNLRIGTTVHKTDAACTAGTSGTDNTTGAVTLNPGNYNVNETAGTGTNLSNYSSAITGDCASNGDVTLAYGDSKTCTITNTRRTFNVTVFVCETTGGTTTLYKSVVTLDGTDKTSLGSVPGSPSGLAASDLCRTDGAGYSSVAPGATHPANVNIGTSQAP